MIGESAKRSSSGIRRIATRVALDRCERGTSPDWYFFTANQARAARATSILASPTGASAPLTHESLTRELS